MAAYAGTVPSEPVADRSRPSHVPVRVKMENVCAAPLLPRSEAVEGRHDGAVLDVDVDDGLEGGKVQCPAV